MKNKLNEELKTKYPHLEINVLKLSEVRKDNETFRIDSEYFKKEYCKNEQILKNLEHEVFDNLIVKMAGGATPLGAEYEESGIPFLRVQNIMQNCFNLNDIVYISKRDDEILKRSRLKLGDVLLTITGAYGKSAVVETELIGANINQHSVKIEVRNINPYFLSTFLNSKFGQLQSDKNITGITRPALDYQSIKKFLIPLFPKEFQLKIEKLVKDSHAALESSKALYKEAENLLYAELGIENNNMQNVDCRDLTKDSVDCREFANANSRNDSNPSLTTTSSLRGSKASEAIHSLESKYPHLNIRIKSLKDSLQRTGRLDAEYYQSKYEKIEALIKSYPGGYCKLKDLITQYSSGFAFSSNDYLDKGKLALIRINNIKNASLDLSNAIYLKDQAQNLSPKDKVRKNDILISMSGSIGLSCVVRENLNAMVNQRILKISIDKFCSDVLVLFLNSVFARLQFERIGTGGVQTNISANDMQNILIPNIDSKIQEKIALKIQKSFELHAQSKELLELAKAKVENAIESIKADSIDYKDSKHL